VDKLLETSMTERTVGVIETIGRNIRRYRLDRGLTLQSLADQTGLSASMLSLLERGKTAPSISTLVGISATLGAQMSDLLDYDAIADGSIVSRSEDQIVLETEKGIRRRILKQDRARGIEIAINEYEPGTSSAPRAQAHEGYEFGIVLEGTLEVTINNQVEVLNTGDLVSYPSTEPHRFANVGRRRVRTLWINLRRP
jgi:transcriptional regulator with XRE-family HTH domain